MKELERVKKYFIKLQKLEKNTENKGETSILLINYIYKTLYIYLIIKNAWNRKLINLFNKISFFKKKKKKMKLNLKLIKMLREEWLIMHWIIMKD